MTPPTPVTRSAQITHTAPMHRIVTSTVGAALRSQLSYRASFAADVFAQAVYTVSELIEILLLFYVAKGAYAGVTVTQGLMIFGLCALSFALADLLMGHTDDVGSFIRTGTLETMLIRPLPLLVTLSTMNLQLRRLSRLSLGVLAYGIALATTSVAWSPATVAVAIIAPLSGAAIFCAMFVLAGAVQFFIIDGSQAANVLTYAGNYAASVPAGALYNPVRMFFTYVVPATLVAYVPTHVLTGAPLPWGMPEWIVWWVVPAAMIVWGVALIAWRAGVRRYTGAGG